MKYELHIQFQNPLRNDDFRIPVYWYMTDNLLCEIHRRVISYNYMWSTRNDHVVTLKVEANMFCPC